MPWMVAFFGVLVIPLGLIHIILMVSQPVIVHHWCSMCLLAALIMLPMLPLEVDEVVAISIYCWLSHLAAVHGSSRRHLATQLHVVSSPPQYLH